MRTINEGIVKALRDARMAALSETRDDLEILQGDYIQHKISRTTLGRKQAAMLEECRLLRSAIEALDEVLTVQKLPAARKVLKP